MGPHAGMSNPRPAAVRPANRDRKETKSWPFAARKAGMRTSEADVNVKLLDRRHPPSPDMRSADSGYQNETCPHARPWQAKGAAG